MVVSRVRNGKQWSEIPLHYESFIEGKNLENICTMYNNFQKNQHVSLKVMNDVTFVLYVDTNILRGFMQSVFHFFPEIN